MKTSKMDQIRALREAGVDTIALSVAALKEDRVDLGPIAESLRDKLPILRLAEPRKEVTPHRVRQPGKPKVGLDIPAPPVVIAAADRPGAVPLLAREGKCASCDRRRALLKAAKARRRAKQEKP